MLYLFSQYFVWQFVDIPKEILKAWRNFLLFYLDYFSVPLLLKTYFSYWHKYYYSYGRGFDPWRFVEAFVFNVFSRIMGAILRTFLIIAGIIAEIVIFFAGLAVFIGWIVLPFLLLLLLFTGIRIVII